MIRQILAQPFVPGEIDLLQRRGMSFVTAVMSTNAMTRRSTSARCGSAQKFSRTTHRTFRFQLGQCPIHLLLTDPESP